jgi:hypothetical protein
MTIIVRQLVTAKVQNVSAAGGFFLLQKLMKLFFNSFVSHAS